MNEFSFTMSQDLIVILLLRVLGDKINDAAWKLSKEEWIVRFSHNHQIRDLPLE